MHKSSWHKLFSSVCRYLAIFAHISLICMHETDLDELNNNHRLPRRQNYVIEYMAIPDENKSLQRDCIDNLPYDSQESCLIGGNI